MRNYAIRIEIPEGRVKEILDRMTKAQETIYECYQELEELGVVTVTENAASGN